MSSTPFMPLWVSNFVGDTMDLDAAETGAYLLLLMAQWNMGGESLPHDFVKLQRIARCGRNWSKIWAVVGRYFSEDECGYFNEKCRDVYKNVAAKREVNSHNGALGGRAKALKLKNSHVANANDLPQRNPSILELELEIATTSVVAAAPEASPIHSESDLSESEATDRERLLSAMGLDPSGMSGPNGKRLGTMADMEIAAKWLEKLTIDDQCKLIVEKVAAAKAKSPGFAPRSFAYFTAAMADFAALKAQPMPQGVASGAKSGRDAQIARWAALGKKSA